MKSYYYGPHGQLIQGSVEKLKSLGIQKASGKGYSDAEGEVLDLKKKKKAAPAPTAPARKSSKLLQPGFASKAPQHNNMDATPSPSFSPTPAPAPAPDGDLSDPNMASAPFGTPMPFPMSMAGAASTDNSGASASNPWNVPPQFMMQMMQQQQYMFAKMMEQQQQQQQPDHQDHTFRPHPPSKPPARSPSRSPLKTLAQPTQANSPVRQSHDQLSQPSHASMGTTSEENKLLKSLRRLDDELAQYNGPPTDKQDGEENFSVGSKPAGSRKTTQPKQQRPSMYGKEKQNRRASGYADMHKR